LSPYYQSPADRPSAVQPPELDSQLQQRLLLIGDAGWPGSREPVLQSLRETAREKHSKTKIIFLGDNIYLNGMPPETSKERIAAESHLNRQLEAISCSGATGIFIPGNHEWHKSSYKSADEDFAIRPKAEAEFIHARLGSKADFRPQPGCFGPDKIDLPGVRLIIFDSACSSIDSRRPIPSWPRTPTAQTRSRSSIVLANSCGRPRIARSSFWRITR
jgi:hypothetical protein